MGVWAPDPHSRFGSNSEPLELLAGGLDVELAFIWVIEDGPSSNVLKLSGFPANSDSNS